jgi:hypothetical protein
MTELETLRAENARLKRGQDRLIFEFRSRIADLSSRIGPARRPEDIKARLEEIYNSCNSWGDKAADADLAELRAENKRLKEELLLWKPLTREEAERAMEEAESIPMSDDAIAEIVKRATDPAETVTNSEQAQLAIRIRNLSSELAELRRVAGELAAALQKAIEFVIPNTTDLVKAYSGELSAEMVCQRIREQKAELQSVLASYAKLTEAKS